MSGDSLCKSLPPRTKTFRLFTGKNFCHFVQSLPLFSPHSNWWHFPYYCNLPVVLHCCQVANKNPRGFGSVPKSLLPRTETFSLTGSLLGKISVTLVSHFPKVGIRNFSPHLRNSAILRTSNSVAELQTKKSCRTAIADFQNLTSAIPQLCAVSAQFHYFLVAFTQLRMVLKSNQQYF